MRRERNGRKPRRHPNWPWLLLALFLLGVAINYSTLRVTKDTFRFLFVLDISQSMNVSDLRSGGDDMTRLDYSKLTIATAIRTLPCGSEAGLAIFSGHRTFVMFTPVEVCEHFSALSEMLENIHWQMAWESRSEVAKGLYSAMEAADLSGPDTRLVFLTDGHEAPPLSRDILSSLQADSENAAGIIAGVGGPVPVQIPHLDDNGNITGYWRHDEVMQIDLHSLGRPGTEGGETMVGVNMANIARRIALGQEHLSSIREAHLKQLAARSGLDYLRVESPSAFANALLVDEFSRQAPELSDFGWFPATLAFASLAYCLLMRPWRQRALQASRPVIEFSLSGRSLP